MVKKVLAKVDKIRGKKEKVLSVRERMEAQRDRNQAIQYYAMLVLHIMNQQSMIIEI